MNAEDQVAVTGTLSTGAVASLHEGGAVAPDFAHAVARHRLLDQIEPAAATR